MRTRDRKDGKAHLVFYVLFFVFYMTDAAGGYFMIYLKSIGFNTLQMGLLTSAAALVALCVQPYIGRLADRSKTKNAVLSIALICAGGLALLLRLSQAFWYILAIYTGFIIAKYVLHPLTDTITLEYTSANNIAFGPIRTMGCIGYAMMASIAGAVAEGNPANTFFLYALTALLTLLVLRFVPISRGMQKGTRGNPLLIFRNPILLKYTLFAIVFEMTKAFFSNYYPVYFTGELGGTANLYGIQLSMGALTEIPLIFFLDRLIRRFGTRRVVLSAACLETVRWLLTALVISPYAQFGIHVVMGASKMVMSISMVMFVNQLMPPETKATGQASYVMLTSIGSLLLGNLLGGALSNFVGIRTVFFLCGGINILALIWLAADKTTRIQGATG